MRHNRARLEDLRWMTETGENTTGAARRLGISTQALEKWCRTHTREEWQTLRSRDYIERTRNGGVNQWRAA